MGPKGFHTLISDLMVLCYWQWGGLVDSLKDGGSFAD